MFSCNETYDSVDIVCSDVIKYNILLILSNISMFKDAVTVKALDGQVLRVSMGSMIICCWGQGIGL